MITGKELIEKMYSDNYSEYEDTRLYSTGDDYLDDLLEKAFCEGYEYAQREFARRDYEGLSPEQAEFLRKNRSDYAKQLNDLRKKTANADREVVDNNWDIVRWTGKIRGGGVESNLRQESTRGSDMNREQFGRFHKNAVRNNMLDTSAKAKKIMRQNAENYKPEPKVSETIKESVKSVKPDSNKPSFQNLPKSDKKGNSNWVKNNKKALAIGGTATALVGTGAYLVHRHNKKKKEEKDKKGSKK